MGARTQRENPHMQGVRLAFLRRENLHPRRVKTHTRDDGELAHARSGGDLGQSLVIPKRSGAFEPAHGW